MPHTNCTACGESMTHGGSLAEGRGAVSTGRLRSEVAGAAAAKAPQAAGRAREQSPNLVSAKLSAAKPIKPSLASPRQFARSCVRAGGVQRVAEWER